MKARLSTAAVLMFGVLGAGTAAAAGPDPSGQVDSPGPRLRATMASTVTAGTMVPAARRTTADPLGDRRGAAQMKRIRSATRRFHNIATAETAGYVQLKDINGISCISDPVMGGMGVHYVNPGLIEDPAIDATRPEALVFAPDRDGTLRLAALEYLVDVEAWDASRTPGRNDSGRPVLFRGHPFDVTSAPNRFGLPEFYSQHVWAWKWNPSGRLSMWNPTVNCSWA